MIRGIITGSGPNAALTGQVAPVSQTILTLAATVLSLLQSDPSGVKRIVVVNFEGRTMWSKESVAGDMAAAVAAATPTTSGNRKGFYAVSFADITKNSSLISIAADGTVSGAGSGDILTPLGTAPTRNAAGDLLDSAFGLTPTATGINGVVGAIEDALIANAAQVTPADIRFTLVYDQLTDATMVIAMNAAGYAETNMPGFTEDAAFVQTPVAAGAGGGVYGI